MADWLCSFSLIAHMFCGVAATTLSGYIEGEPLFVAPIESAPAAGLLTVSPWVVASQSAITAWGYVLAARQISSGRIGSKL